MEQLRGRQRAGQRVMSDCRLQFAVCSLQRWSHRQKGQEVEACVSAPETVCDNVDGRARQRSLATPSSPQTDACPLAAAKQCMQWSGRPPLQTAGGGQSASLGGRQSAQLHTVSAAVAAAAPLRQCGKLAMLKAAAPLSCGVAHSLARPVRPLRPRP